MNVRIDGKWYYVETAEQLLELLNNVAEQTPVWLPVVWEAEIVLGYTPTRVAPGVGGFVTSVLIPPGTKFYLELSVGDLEITYSSDGQQTFVAMTWRGVRIPQVLGKAE